MIGSNVPTKGGFSTGFQYGDLWGCECIQIYITPSRRWNVPELLQKDIVAFKHAWDKSSVMQVVAHVPFLVNLASPDKTIRKKSMKRLHIEVSRALKLGIPFLVLHPGSYSTSTKQKGMYRIIEALNEVTRECVKTKNEIKILLETMAGQGNMIGSSFEDIQYILHRVALPEFFGVCFDTAHVFIAGYDIRGYNGYNRILTIFDNVIGLDKIEVIHLNDSKTGLGSKNDRHACIGEGKLGLDFFHAIIRDKKFYNIPKILEIPKRDTKSEDNLTLLRKLQKCTRRIFSDERLLQLTLEEVTRCTIK